MMNVKLIFRFISCKTTSVKRNVYNVTFKISAMS